RLRGITAAAGRPEPRHVWVALRAELQRARRVALRVDLAAQEPRKRVRREKLQMPAGHLPIQIVDVAAGDGIHAEARMRIALHGEPAEHTLGDRAAERCLDIELVVVADRHARIALELGRRLSRDQVYRAADGVASVERALRAPQNLDSLEIEE